jgi:fructose-1,6-bisphosphatase/inositol monophosphatase family enzyme
MTINPSDFISCVLPELKSLSALLLTAAKGDKGGVSTKRDGSLVTEIDRLVEARLVEVLGARFSQVPILGEEGAIDVGIKGAGELYTPFIQAEEQIVIDPIDGTRNFIDGHREYCMAVALCRKVGEGIWPIAGVVLIPEFAEVYLCDGLSVSVEDLRSGIRMAVKREGPKETKLSVNSRDRAWLVSVGLAAAVPWISSGSSVYDFLNTSLGRQSGSIVGAQRLWDLMAPLAIASTLGLVLRDISSDEIVSSIGMGELSAETELRPWGLARKMLLAPPGQSISELVGRLA